MSCTFASMSDALASIQGLAAASSSVRRGCVVACVAALAASGCTSMRSKIEPPAITLDAVRVTRIAEAKADISLKLTLANHNDVELAVDRVEFDVTLDGRPAVNGRSVHIDPLAPGAEAKVELAGRVDATTVATALM